MAKKAPKESKRPAASGPTFRPLEAQLKALAAKAKQEEREKAEAAKKAAAQPAKKSTTTPTPTRPADGPKPSTPRPSTLTRDEQRELEMLERSHDDEFFFRRLMAGVVPLDEDQRGRIGSAPKLPKRVAPAAPAQDPDQEARDHLMNLVEGGARFEVIDDGKRLEGRRLDLVESTFKRLRRGEFPIDARLDLHGRRADEARDVLERFLREKRQRRDRVVLVIHGRGEHSPAGIGVLRGEIAAWLSQGRASQHVAAFATAHDDEGGEGALYVLLRP
jgi:DNA-nicking Smr family endonuclease